MKTITKLIIIKIIIAITQARYVYIGTAQDLPGGIVIFSQNNDGTLTPYATAPASEPWWIDFHPSGKFAYTMYGNGYGAYSVLSDGNLSLINTQPSGGDGPTYVSVHPSGNFIFGANYNDGTFVVFPINEDGSIGAISDIQKPGVGDNAIPSRQEGPHAHMITTTPNPFKIVGMDLGADKMWIFDFDQNQGKINVATEVPYGQVGSGSGCRHIVFHPTQDYAYVVSEMSSALHSFIFNATSGSFVTFQTVSTVPDDYSGVATYAGEIRIDAKGQYIYVTNRGADTVAVFSVNPSNGKVSPVQSISSFGNYPRGMNIDPTGKWLYVANQNGNNVVAYSIDPSSGQLSFLAQYPVVSAVDVEFIL